MDTGIWWRMFALPYKGAVEVVYTAQSPVLGTLQTPWEIAGPIDVTLASKGDNPNMCLRMWRKM